MDIGLSDNKHNTSSSSSSPVVVSGILFSRSVRSAFASFTLAPISSSSSSSTSPAPAQQSLILVRLQFKDNVQELRSFCRKRYKLGDQIDFLYTNSGRWQKLSERLDKNETIDQQRWSQQSRWVMDLSSTSDTERLVFVRASRVWSMRNCQQYQLRYIPQKKKEKQQRQQQQHSRQRKQKDNNNNGEQQTQKQPRSLLLNVDDDTLPHYNHHGGAKGKRLQAEELASFLMQMVGGKLLNSQQHSDIEKITTVVNIMDLKEASTVDDLDDTATTRTTTTTTAAAVVTKSPIMTTTTIKQIRHQQDICDWLNRGGGVLDVSGGCGHISMALGMNGVLSTVVDARSSVGKLPRRDRKIWKRKLLNKPQRQRWEQQIEGETQIPHTNNQVNTYINYTVSSKQDYVYCQPIVSPPVVVPVPFQSQQAWFGSKPSGYDVSFRHPDKECLPIMVATAISDDDSDNHKTAQDNSSKYDGKNNHDLNDVQSNADSLLSSSSLVLRHQTTALVALHPDEATAEIVQQAVTNRIPFLVVPCCVFARLFPERKTKNGQSVSTYENLLEYLQEMDTSIQRTTLSFGGKNIALWSVFPD